MDKWGGGVMGTKTMEKIMRPPTKYEMARLRHLLPRINIIINGQRHSIVVNSQARFPPSATMMRGYCIFA